MIQSETNGPIFKSLKGENPVKPVMATKLDRIAIPHPLPRGPKKRPRPKARQFIREETPRKGRDVSDASHSWL
jgi:hypothetical protein